jgi:predicted DNA-binding transcriptional regulator YafY
LQLARRQFHFGQNRLSHIAANLGVRMGQAHRALNDVYMTAEVLKRMARQLAAQRIETVGDLLMAQGGPIYLPAPPHVNLPPPLDEAMANGRSLRILYLGEGGETRRIIRPHYPAEHEGVVYLVAFCHLRQDTRTFRLDRIFSAELL